MNYTNGLAKEDFLQYMFQEFPNVYDNSNSRELLTNIVDYFTEDNFTHTKNDLFYALKRVIPEIQPTELLQFIDKNMITNEVVDGYVTDKFSFEYQLLGRLQQDCKYYLGAGARNNKCLWAGNVKDQIAKMRELMNKVPVEPEWLSAIDITDYEKQMTSNIPSKVTSNFLFPVTSISAL